MKCPKCNSPMDESNHDSIGIAECYFCGFRLVSDEQEEGNGEISAGFAQDGIAPRG
jgi:Zn ribbon nucleic-acid-binding protein